MKKQHTFWALATLVFLKISSLQASYYTAPDHHEIARLAVDSSSLEIEDNSQWKVARSDQFILNSWQKGDPIMITANHAWMPNSKYYMTNKRTGNYIGVDLYLGPVLKSRYRNRIVHIDDYHGVIELMDGRGNHKRFAIERDDRHLIQAWQPNQAIIVGTNDGWFTNWLCTCETILINVQKNEHVRSRLF